MRSKSLDSSTEAIGRLLTNIVAYAGAHLAQTGVACAHVATMGEDGSIDIHHIPDDGIPLDTILNTCVEIIEKAGCQGYGIAVHMAWDRPGSRDGDIVAVRVESKGVEVGGIYDVDRTKRQAALRRRHHNREHPAVRALRYTNRHVRH